MAEEEVGETGHSLRMDMNWKVENEFIRLELLALVLRAWPPKETSLVKSSPIDRLLRSITPQPCDPIKTNT